MDNEKKSGRNSIGEFTQLSFSFKTTSKSNNVVCLESIRRANKKSSDNNSHTRIISKFIKHSEKLDW
jgi:hypothetical protein